MIKTTKPRQNIMAAVTNENNSFAERDPEELFCLKWNDFTVRIQIPFCVPWRIYIPT